ncbi:low affinity iron permease family protein [Mesorhizobium sp. BR1-1-7]|uniref:low affinity iron permease family protein n=1 Tax=Mesorhizobium sp. BR1-1-7 TaxID=2876647 RepID=UPI001CCE482E|nr:low affinity iron permease family protein [Mesorhizobium sp. BR1-1-7]MBZ9922421.1 low affinity iron permease family protein [Mesorhizobium sp. BR1-1-7]
MANAVARAIGRPWTFALCAKSVVAWAISGPTFGFSETWQLIINTGTTIITFLMVFLIQPTADWHRVGKGRGERELGSRPRSKRSISRATDEARPFRHPLRRQVEEEVKLPQKGSA